jgi:hypothetical protein
MAAPILGLLILLHFSGISVSGSALRISKVCGSEQVAYLENLDGHQILINGNEIENSTLVCEKLKFYFEVGCFSCDPKLGVWREVSKNYCARDSDFLLHEEKIANSGELSHLFCIFTFTSSINFLYILGLHTDFTSYMIFIYLLQ